MLVICSVKTFLYSFFWLVIYSLQADGVSWLPQSLMDKAEKEFGMQAQQQLKSWGAMSAKVTKLSEQEKLKAVNDYFNQHVPYVTDQAHWGQEDYWATPYEILTTNGADCEDYVIAKYYTLKKLGVPVEKMRITYVKALKINQAHMVLSYFPAPGAMPLILDNLVSPILPASKRKDLAPVYSFNAGGLYLERLNGQGIKMGNPNKLDVWSDLTRRMAAIGLDM